MFAFRWFCLLLALSGACQASTLVRVKPAQEVLQAHFLKAPAVVVNETHPAISAEISATLKQVSVKVGDRVRNGDRLFTQDCRDMDLQLKQQESALEALNSEVKLARQQLTRVKKLRKSGSASVELLNQRQTEVSALSARIRAQESLILRSEINTSRCEVNAPFDGVITALLASEGDYLTPGKAVIKLLNTSASEVKARLLPEQISSLKSSSQVEFIFSGDTYPLAMRTIVPLVDQSARTLEARLAFTASKAVTGANGELRWHADSRTLPAEYLLRRKGQLGVMVAEGNIARFLPLPDALEGQATPIKSGLEKVQLIVQGQYVLNDGDEITLQEATEDAAATAE